MTILVVTAVEAERDAVVRDLGMAEPLDVAGFSGVRVETPAGTVHAVSCGVGPVAAAVVTARLAAAVPYELVLSAGIAGGFRARVEIGSVVAADRVTFADLGVRTDDGFRTPTEIGLRQDTSYAVRRRVVELLANRGGACAGEILTLACMTGTRAEALSLAERHPHAIAEAMEGFGVVEAIERSPNFSGAVGEIRAISNFIGPRDPTTWEIPRALDALSTAFVAILKEPLP